MTENKVYTYKEVYTANLTLYADGQVKMSGAWAHHVLGTINKMACINVANQSDLASQLAFETGAKALSPGSSLYVASECKTARDTFRNSGYSITRSPEKADAIIVPDVIASNYYTLEYNLVAYHPEKDELYLFYVEKPGYLISQLDIDDIVLLRNFLTNRGYEPLAVDRMKIKIWFIPKCDEIRNILEKNIYPNKPYIQESLVQIKASTQVSPETLVFWENINDANLLTRTICTSDCLKYPVTLLAFFKCCKLGFGTIWNASNNDFKRIMKSCGLEYYWDLDGALGSERVISPADYDMLQAYLFYKLGFSENGGFINANKFKDIPPIIAKLLRKMVAIKPMKIPVKMKLGDVEALSNS